MKAVVIVGLIWLSTAWTPAGDYIGGVTTSSREECEGIMAGEGAAELKAAGATLTPCVAVDPTVGTPGAEPKGKES